MGFPSGGWNADLGEMSGYACQGDPIKGEIPDASRERERYGVGLELGAVPTIAVRGLGNCR